MWQAALGTKFAGRAFRGRSFNGGRASAGGGGGGGNARGEAAAGTAAGRLDRLLGRRISSEHSLFCSALASPWTCHVLCLSSNSPRAIPCLLPKHPFTLAGAATDIHLAPGHSASRLLPIACPLASCRCVLKVWWLQRRLAKGSPA